MDHYLDIHIRTDPEFSAPQLMNALFSKLHQALVALKSTGIGVSFPEVDEEKPSLGTCLRLHGTAAALSTLMEWPWLQGLRDYLHLGKVSPVPMRAQHRQVRRVLTKSNPERLRRRQIRRHGYQTEEDARQAAIQRLIKDHQISYVAASKQVDRTQKCELPFLSLKSQSTGQAFRLFIRHDPPVHQPQAGFFNSYGLSASATVPWF
ncbi:MAG: type I-F CRISPR-associated endoribonuclease Cas6/Csy4 [Azoarcus sp.]|jgi:CRISPR-associated endonuclease Csy4|nr:type I-F CRISPR-associated endoribonuclease Cas6/Csy4 [Azoarcus sp.]